MSATLAPPQLLSISVFRDDRGSLAVLELAQQLPFAPARFYFVFDTPSDVTRAGHCHWREREAIFAMRGAFTVTFDDGCTRHEIRLDDPTQLLLIPSGVWHELHSFTPDALCAVFASHPYDPSDYCHDYSEFQRLIADHGASHPPSRRQ